jgi:hypothetical protein
VAVVWLAADKELLFCFIALNNVLMPVVQLVLPSPPAQAGAFLVYSATARAAPSRVVVS